MFLTAQPFCQKAPGIVQQNKDKHGIIHGKNVHRITSAHQNIVTGLRTTIENEIIRSVLLPALLITFCAYRRYLAVAELFIFIK